MGNAIDRLAAELMRLPASAWAHLDALRALDPADDGAAATQAEDGPCAPRTEAANVAEGTLSAGKAAPRRKPSRKNIP